MDVSMYIRTLLEESGRTQKEAAKALGCASTQCFRNKLHKRSFTLEQFLTLAEAFGWNVKVEIPIREMRLVTTGTKEISLIGEES